MCGSGRPGSIRGAASRGRCPSSTVASSVARRHVCGDARAGVLAQHALALRPRPRHRHRRRRRDRGRGERGAPHRAGTVTGRGNAARDGRSLGADRRHRAGALRGVRPDGVHQRPDRPVLPPVRADHRHLDCDLRVQLADPEPGAGVAAAPPPRRAARSRAARSIDRLFGWFFRGFNRVLHARVDAYAVGVVARVARRRCRAGGLRRPDRLDRPRVLARAAGFRPVAGQGLPGRVRATARRRDARSHRRGHPRDVGDRAEAPRRRRLGGVSRPVDQRLRQRVEYRHRVRDAEAVGGARRART